ncbi:MAG: monovalent cation/H+ antiporter complex subunit F [Candidatus Tectimicrobiota bacterium]
MTLAEVVSIQALMPPLLAILSVALFLAFLRLVRGPTLPDRVVALDLITVLVVAIIALYGMATHEHVLLDAALVLALLAFLGTVALARYIERRAQDD